MSVTIRIAVPTRLEREDLHTGRVLVNVVLSQQLAEALEQVAVRRGRPAAHLIAHLRVHGQVQAAIDKSGIKEGLCLVNAMHISASVYINDDESGLLHDYDKWLEKLAPHEPVNQYRHNDTGEDNADAHLKRQVMGREVVVAVTKGKLDFGPWEQIFYGEFDGRRDKRVLIKIIGE